MNNIRKIVAAVVLLAGAMPVYAGFDASGLIARMWVTSNGDLYFVLNNTSANVYCKPGWYGFNFVVPKGDTTYPYYYGVITTAIAKSLTVDIPNLDVFNGTGPCDITKTGYGIVLLGP